ncbi:zinc transporter ZIP13 [Ammospiza nelsoni]|uniref:zinc transporter ZIP13 n=1 Tax=Ammospiza caudacuta TaxID=2857398 RepID=UPI0027392EBB|nr:zinc transporter ZIP13 [Ammospiza caudacuta]XP_058662727.1 zinc transporter ZIP13 [Ammospiza caudacuta]XP_058662728.1 zinc transporter ZIP13 [Ammospiza caudacuta]XP_058662729.1 zinc transporter ZIP13 [Ammospiza caudacuta]XP_059330687.1 zinc transporter ZIP13 [Ammospiza nelsoni]XP_059330688.1 zinc transporter ZIP13 [Ammospiza nelsoni]XP_059330689.1 zinc transporter ZIP13 [Ammospiza nelsoni]XP_059330691.1 zinc transporter ZIP13 [Ammospiza nelsoni]
MTKQKLLFDGTLSLLLIAACEAQQLPRSHVAASSGSVCDKETDSWGHLLSSERLDAWICSLIGSFMVGLSGVFPLLVIPLETGAALRSEAGSQRLKQLLSFAIGGLLGNVFLHLLPEAWAYTCSATTGEGQSFQQQKLLGLWVIIGFLTFLVLEKIFLEKEEEYPGVDCDSKAPSGKIPNGSGCPLPKGSCQSQRARAQCNGSSLQSGPKNNRIKISGYLNLLANTIDNFTHGLAVAASFLVSRKVGFLTTMAILLHEIPHEVGDFAILLRAGFDRWSAAKMQLSTALGGILGACFAICAQSPKGAGETVAWILPFTSGGFLYIALVNVVPDLLEEKNPWNSLQQILLLCTGITVMVLLALTTE